MKTRNIRKVIIPSFALLIGASLTATISSTLAWFQYATRAQVAYVGAVVHGSKLLKISVDKNQSHWGNEYYKDYMANHIEGNHLLPITTGPLLKNEGLAQYNKDLGNGQFKTCSIFYSQPDFGRGGDYSTWAIASDTNYAQFTIYVKVNDVDGYSSAPLVNDVYITKLLIEDDSANGTDSDLSDSVRVHFAVTDANNQTKYLLFAKNVTSTAVGGTLDLNNDRKIDTEIGSWGERECMYGVENGKQYSYTSNDINAVVPDPDNPVSGSNPISLGKTGNKVMKIVVTTWIEGWSLLNHGYGENASGETNTAVWDASYYINKVFNVGIQLGVKSHNSDHQN